MCNVGRNNFLEILGSVGGHDGSVDVIGILWRQYEEFSRNPID